MLFGISTDYVHEIDYNQHDYGLKAKIIGKIIQKPSYSYIYDAVSFHTHTQSIFQLCKTSDRTMIPRLAGNIAIIHRILAAFRNDYGGRPNNFNVSSEFVRVTTPPADFVAYTRYYKQLWRIRRKQRRYT